MRATKNEAEKIRSDLAEYRKHHFYAGGMPFKYQGLLLGQSITKMKLEFQKEELERLEKKVIKL